MSLPKIGLSGVRSYLVPRDEGLESFARDALSSPGRHVGSLVCLCSEVNQWSLSFREEQQSAVLSCHVNNEQIPAYIVSSTGQQSHHAQIEAPTHPCERTHFQIAIAIGYPGDIPLLGNVEVEQAREIAIVGRCRICHERALLWRLVLDAPPVFLAGDPRLKHVHRFTERTLWETLPPREQAKHPEAPPEQLLELSQTFPEEVSQNPLLPLIALESPILWRDIQHQIKKARSLASLHQFFFQGSTALSLEQWRVRCVTRALDSYAPLLLEAQRQDLRAQAKSPEQDVNIEHYERSRDARWRAKRPNTTPEQRVELYQTAATEMTLHLFSALSTPRELSDYAAEAAAYAALALGQDEHEWALREYQWQLDSIALEG